MREKYVVFDRDGTLIKHIPYLHDVDRVELLPTVKESIELLIENNCKLFLHTNQSGVSRKYFKLTDVTKCNNMMLELINLGNKLFVDICVATDFPANKITYRKPSPKFGLEIIEKYKIYKDQLFYVGDSISDYETAVNIGCKFFGVNTGLIDLKSKKEEIIFDVSKSLLDVANKIINCN